MDLTDTNYKLMDLKCTFAVCGPKCTSGAFYSSSNVVSYSNSTCQRGTMKNFFFLKIKAGALPIHLRGSKMFKDTEILQKNLSYVL